MNSVDAWALLRKTRMARPFMFCLFFLSHTARYCWRVRSLSKVPLNQSIFCYIFLATTTSTNKTMFHFIILPWKRFPLQLSCVSWDLTVPSKFLTIYFVFCNTLTVSTHRNTKKAILFSRTNLGKSNFCHLALANMTAPDILVTIQRLWRDHRRILMAIVVAWHYCVRIQFNRLYRWP